MSTTWEEASSPWEIIRLVQTLNLQLCAGNHEHLPCDNCGAAT